MDIVLPAGMAFIMFALGCSLTPADFTRVFTTPKAVALGLIGQVIGLPLVAFVCLLAFGLRGEMAVGVMILAACPGGISSGLLTLLARGDTALSVSLTALTSLAVMLTLPAIVGGSMLYFAGAEASVHLPVMRTVGGVVLMTLLPVMLGMGLRHVRPAFIVQRENLLARMATGVFLVIVIATFIKQSDPILAHLPTLGPLLLVMNLGVMALGIVLGKLGRLRAGSQVAIAMECGLQNAALGILVANTLLQQPALAAPSVVYAFLMNFTAITLIVLRRRRAREATI